MRPFEAFCGEPFDYGVDEGELALQPSEDMVTVADDSDLQAVSGPPAQFRIVQTELKDVKGRTAVGIDQ